MSIMWRSSLLFTSQLSLTPLTLKSSIIRVLLFLAAMQIDGISSLQPPSYPKGTERPFSPAHPFSTSLLVSCSSCWSTAGSSWGTASLMTKAFRCSHVASSCSTVKSPGLNCASKALLGETFPANVAPWRNSCSASTSS